jgi:thiol-disulfide isomerase/thioredoxin
MDEKTIYLENTLWYMRMSELKTFDSAVIKNGKFEFRGKTDSSYMALLSIDNQPFVNIFVENGDIKLNIPEDINKSIATGTKLNDLSKLYDENIDQVRSKMTEFMQYVNSQEPTEKLQQEVSERYKALQQEMLQISVKFLEENPGTLLSAYILISGVLSLGGSEETIQSIYDKLEENVKRSALGNLISKELSRMKFKELSIGEMYRDMTMKTPDGKNISLSDYVGKGKYVFIDFWASWCGYCRQENPNVVALYKEYKNKGFEIIGVSLDSDREAWIKGISDDGITWPQMSDLKEWDSEAVIKYRIKGIPFTVLLDKEGKVIDVNLKGEKLKDKLKTLMP